MIKTQVKQKLVTSNEDFQFFRMETAWNWWKDWWRLRKNSKEENSKEGEASFYIVRIYVSCAVYINYQ